MKKAPFFWIWLGLLTIGNILTIVYYAFSTSAYYVERLYPSFPISSWMIYILLLQLGGIILLWKWYRVGFHIMTGCSALAAFLTLVSTATTTGFGAAIGQVILILLGSFAGLGLLYLFMRPLWDSFITEDVSSKTRFSILLLLIGVSSVTLLLLKTYGIMLMWNTPKADFSLGAIFWGYMLLVLQIIGVLSLWKTKEKGFLFILVAAVTGTILAGAFDVTTATLGDSTITIIITALLMFEPITEKIKKRS